MKCSSVTLVPTPTNLQSLTYRSDSVRRWLVQEAGRVAAAMPEEDSGQVHELLEFRRMERLPSCPHGKMLEVNICDLSIGDEKEDS